MEREAKRNLTVSSSRRLQGDWGEDRVRTTV